MIEQGEGGFKIKGRDQMFEMLKLTVEYPAYQGAVLTHQFLDPHFAVFETASDVGQFESAATRVRRH